jgi:hypothetical protein
MNLDRDLQRALGRKHPAPGFSERVLGRLGHGGSGREPPRRSVRRRFALGLGAGAALAAVLAMAAVHHLEQQHQDEGERARQQVMAALQIAGAKVRLARDELGEMARERMEGP